MSKVQVSESTEEEWNLKLWMGWALGLFFLTFCTGFLAATLIPGAFKGFGEFGDFVGGIANPLLALMGLLALLFTIRLQLRELSLSRKELELTREELKRSATALEEQTNHLDKQQLSRAFFDLFEMYKSVVSEIGYGAGSARVSGKEALERYRNRFYFHSVNQDHPWDLKQVQNLHSDFNDELGNYFRMIFRMLSFLRDKGEDAEFFADMFRAQLNTSELHLLFFNCVSEVGQPMEEFGKVFELFDNMSAPPGENFGSIAKKLDKKSFGKNKQLLSLVS